MHAHATLAQVPDHSSGNVMTQIGEVWKSVYEMLDQALATNNFKLERTLVGFLSSRRAGDEQMIYEMRAVGRSTYNMLDQLADKLNVLFSFP